MRRDDKGGTVVPGEQYFGQALNWRDFQSPERRAASRERAAAANEERAFQARLKRASPGKRQGMVNDRARDRRRRGE